MKLRKLLSVLLAVAMLTAGLPMGAVLASEDVSKPAGSGTVLEPYQITSAAELYWFAGVVNGTLTDGTKQKSNANAVLKADIRINDGVLKADGTVADSTTGFRKWVPIGWDGYTGTFDGDGHTLRGFYVQQDGSAGLFGELKENGTIRNLHMEDSAIVSSGYWTGGICGYNSSGTIENCSVNAYVEGSFSVGGITGQDSRGSSLRNCYVEGAVIGQDGVGGIIGYHCSERGEIENCYSVANVSLNRSDRSDVGMICGENCASINNCYYDSSKGVAGVGNTEGGTRNTVGMTPEQFASGEVAMRLNQMSTTTIYGQKLGEDSIPVFVNDTNRLYTMANCTVFTNDGTQQENPTHHCDGNGLCADCGTYIISDADGLFKFAQIVNEGEAEASAKLTADIILNENLLNENGVPDTTRNLKEWTPIGGSAGYGGLFDGNGYTVSGVYIKEAKFYQMGFFSNVKRIGTVINLGIEDSYIQAFNTSGYVGGMCGYNEGAIKNCFVDATVLGGGTVGGMIGGNNSYSSIWDSYVLGSVCGVGGQTGGFCGENVTWYGLLSNCYSMATVDGELKVGGFSGSTSGEEINCYYLEGCNEEGTTLNCMSGTPMNSKQFASGMVTYLLNEKGTRKAWGQHIGKDLHPTVYDGTNKVYVTTGCVSYNNEGLTSKKEHRYQDGFCVNCGEVAVAEPKSKDGVYQIGLVEELYWLVYQVENVGGVIDATLTADITLNENVRKADGSLVDDASKLKVWKPIGKKSNPYKGTFDGNGHIICGLYYDGTMDGTFGGLFGIIASDGIVKNVGVTDSYFRSPKGYVGGICGINNGGIFNVFFRGSVSSDSYVAGICAENDGVIHSCYADAKIYAEDLYAPIVYSNYSENSCTNCYAKEVIGYREINKTAEQFANGEVAYRLSQGFTGTLNGKTVTVDGAVWGQEIGKDLYPTFSNKKVSATMGCRSYNNAGDTSEKEHDMENGVCKICHSPEMQKPSENEGYYQISNAKELRWFSALVNGTLNDGTEKNYYAKGELTADIILNEKVLNEDGTLVEDTSKLIPWEPIGVCDGDWFAGRLKGNNHTIRGVYVDAQYYGAGLFGALEGTVRDLKLTDSYIKSERCVGGIFGDGHEATVKNCIAEVCVIGKESVGGIGGCGSYADIENCRVYGAVYAEEGYVGGMCGDLYDGTITNSANYATVTTDDMEAGGILGFGDEDCEIEDCANYGEITGYEYIGGICGNGDAWSDYETSIRRCLNIGTVNGEYSVGAICGDDSDPYIRKCYWLDTCEGASTYFDSDGGSSRSADELKSGKVAVTLQGDRTSSVWGQKLGGDNPDLYPNLGGVLVYAYGTVYSNEAPTQIKIWDICKNDGKATAVVTLPSAGTYTVIFADYEDSVLANFDTATVTVEEGSEAVQTVTSTKDLTLGMGDKVMIWNTLNGAIPSCEAYVAQ